VPARCGGMGVARASYWSLRNCPIADSPTRLSRLSFDRLVAADARSNRRPLLWIDRFGIIQLCGLLREREDGVYPAMFGVRAAPAHEEPRSGSNNSEHESTSGRSTNYGSGHLIRVFRDIGCTFSLLLLLSHPSPIGHSLRKRGSKAETEYGFVEGKNGFNCVSCGTRRAEWRSLWQNENLARGWGGVSGTLDFPAASSSRNAAMAASRTRTWCSRLQLNLHFAEL
jgi:hypothetical protein